MNHFNAALAGITAAGLAAAIAFGRSPPSPIVAAEPDRPSFELTWLDAAVPAAIKAEQLRPMFAAKPEPESKGIKSLQNEHLISLVEPKENTVKKHKRKHAERNICTRHNMKKIMVGKYRWRCRR